MDILCVVVPRDELKLFEMDACGDYDVRHEPLRPGYTITITTTVRERCRPSSLRMALELGAALEVLQVHGGVESLLSRPMAFADDGARLELRQVRLMWGDPDDLRMHHPILEPGMHFAVTLKNTSEEPLEFKCEVWDRLA